MIKRHFLVPVILFAFFATTLFSCSYNEGYQAVNVNNKFSISVPAWMKKTEDLKPGAELQYANRFRNFYTIGTVESKTKPLGEITHDNLEVLRLSMKNPVVTDSVDVTLGGLKGIKVEIYGKMSDENVYFTEVVLEGPSSMYHLSIWTRGEDRKLRFKETISQMLNSFKLI